MEKEVKGNLLKTKNIYIFIIKVALKEKVNRTSFIKKNKKTNSQSYKKKKD